MAFERKHRREVYERLVALQVEQGLTARRTFELAQAGKVPGVRPAEVPPFRTIASWASQERAKRAREAEAQAAQDAADTLAAIANTAAVQLRNQSRTLARKKGGGDPKAWAELAKATAEVAKLRRALIAPAGKTPAAILEQPEEAASFLDAVEAEA